MLKPVMNKHLYCQLPAPFEADDVKPGPGPSHARRGDRRVRAGTISVQCAQSLADQLGEKLQDEVVVKSLADAATLINWFDRFSLDAERIKLADDIAVALANELLKSLQN